MLWRDHRQHKKSVKEKGKERAMDSRKEGGDTLGQMTGEGAKEERAENIMGWRGWGVSEGECQSS